MHAVTDPRVESLVAAIETGLAGRADPDYVPGTAAARHPGKPVLGVRIPLLRGTVKAALKSADLDDGGAVVFGASEVLWHGRVHEAELAAAMMLRLTGTTMSATAIERWATGLDNWLSVDELGPVVGMSLLADPALVADLAAMLSGSESVWQRRLYVVALIGPVKAGLSPTEVPALAELMRDPRPPLRKACLWLINQALKARPDAAAQFREVLAGEEPQSVARLLDAALV
ncbi:DNA alkylation repair protein [Nocardia takedensis]|uniref:DNA alkylation repair protein n=1 Tax=Nocardia takedensis TaxID=259390 RepID=UPI003F767D5F